MGVLAINTQNQNRPTLFRLFYRESAATPHIPVTELLPAGAFERQLAIERSRTERSRFIFTIVVFSIESTANEVEHARALKALGSVLVERTRMCDTKGWLGERLAVILPYTTVANARVLVQTIDALFHERTEQSSQQTTSPSLSCAIYEYPADRIEESAEMPNHKPANAVGRNGR